MKTKKIFLFILSLALISFKARAATYNFNFYNNEKEEVPTPTVLPAPAAVVPLAPAVPLSSSDVATSKVEEIKESLFSLGYFISMRSNASEGTGYKGHDNCESDLISCKIFSNSLKDFSSANFKI